MLILDRDSALCIVLGSKKVLRTGVGSAVLETPQNGYLTTLWAQPSSFSQVSHVPSLQQGMHMLALSIVAQD